jgi:hypothetical protein
MGGNNKPDNPKIPPDFPTNIDMMFHHLPLVTHINFLKSLYTVERE